MSHDSYNQRLGIPLVARNTFSHTSEPKHVIVLGFMPKRPVVGELIMSNNLFRVYDITDSSVTCGHRIVCAPDSVIRIRNRYMSVVRSIPRINEPITLERIDLDYMMIQGFQDAALFHLTCEENNVLERHIADL